MSASNNKIRYEDLYSLLRLKSKSKEEAKLAEVYRDALEKNYRVVSRSSEVKEWTSKPFQLDFTIKKKKSAQISCENKLKEIFSDLEFDFGFTSSDKPVDIEFENDYDRLAFSRRHANYAASCKNATDMKRFVIAKNHEANLKQIALERYGELQKIDNDMSVFLNKHTSRAFHGPPLLAK